jgi:hypothetical protein
MKNNSYIKKQKRGWIALVVLFCGLFANLAMGQGTFTWNGATSSNWTTATNWTKSGTATTSTYPGESSSNDLVVINSTNAPNPIILTSPNSFTVARVTVANNFGLVSGAILTINSGATLNIVSNSVSNLLLNGGNIVNNGAITVTTSAPGSSGFPVYGIACGAPVVTPTVATVYGISGSGTLSITLSAANLALSAAIVVTGTTSVLPTYRITMNGTISLNQGSTSTIAAVRTTGSATANKLILAGAGFTVGSPSSPSIGSLINIGAGTTITVDSGTTLTFNSANTYTNSVITGFSSSATATNFTNNGTINILGASLRSGMGFSTGSSGTASVFNISNTGTLNVNLSPETTGNSAFNNGNGGGGTVNAGSAVNFTNSGTTTFKNTSTAVGSGNAIYCTAAGEGAPLIIANSGTLNLNGTTYIYAPKTTINNTGIINSNSEFRNLTAMNNNVGGSINFVKTAGTNTTRQVVFNGLQTTDVSGVIGNVYTDGTNSYTVVVQKFGSGTSLATNVLSGATIPVSGTLTLISGSGGTTPLTFTSVTVPSLNNALPLITSTNTTNLGTINTDTESNLNIVSGVSAASIGTISPGGASGKGIADFSNASTLTINSILKLQVSGNATAGIDYDQITNSATGGGFNLAGATLDVSGIYTPVIPTTVEILTTNATGTLTGSFSSVVGLPLGWAVVYTNGTSGKVELVYGTTTWTGTTNTDWATATNWTAGLPDEAKNVTIIATTNQPIIASNISIKSLTLNASTSLTVTSGFNLTAIDAIINENGGTLIIENNANLIQVNNVSNSGTGTTIINRTGNLLTRNEYTIWSSPVFGQNLLAFSPVTLPSRFYNYSEADNLYNIVAGVSSVPFTQGAGYLIRMPDSNVLAGYNTGDASVRYEGVFTGTANNGDITKSMEYSGVTNGYNMVGNPYPSTIDAQTFIAANAANIESSLYFWRKVNGAGGSAYAIYNPLGGTASTPSSEVPNGTIQVGQGFFVKAKSATDLIFTNLMRVANNVNQFFKTKQATKDCIWLNLTNTSGVFSQALVGYTADATLGLDIFDGKYINDSKIALTSIINNEEYTIQGRPKFDVSDIVALNFKTDVAGEYTIAIDHFDGVFATGQDIYLVDSKTGIETDLKSGSYTFTAPARVDNTRFTLKYQKTLKVEKATFNDNSVRIYKNKGTIYINSGLVAINSVEVYDVQGRLLASQKDVNATTTAISNLRAINQVLIVKVSIDDNRLISKKVVN